MSTQSGITASEDLLDTFKNLNASKSLVIRLSDDNTSLVEDTSYSSPSSAHFDAVADHLTAIHPHPAYIVIPTEEEDDILFASYIPDESPIREKMLYASTKSTILTQLGSNNFKKSHVFAWSEIDEVSLKNFKKETTQHDNDALLTEEERLLKSINSLQSFSIAETSAKNQQQYKKQLASMHDHTPSATGSTSSLGSSVSSVAAAGAGVNFKISSDLDDALNSFATPSNLLTFFIDLPTETVVLSSSSTSVSTSSLIDKLTKTQDDAADGPHPQYALYSYAADKVAFIYSCPSGSKVKERMVYASNKKSLLTHIKSVIETDSLKIDKNFEVGDLDELELSEFNEEKEESASTRLKFNKPKGPRRR